MKQTSLISTMMKAQKLNLDSQNGHHNRNKNDLSFLKISLWGHI